MSDWRIRTPIILQIEAIECGAVCLGIILKYFGKSVSMGELRTRCAVSRDGSNGLDLVKAAKFYELAAKGIETSREGLQNLKTPAILFWENSHFVVLEGFLGSKAYINDPAFGPISMSLEEFDQKFSRVALLMHPEEAFEKSEKPYGIWTLLQEIWKGVHFFYPVLCTLFTILPLLALPLVLRTLVDHAQFSNMDLWKWKCLAILLGALLLGIYYSILNQLFIHRFASEMSRRAASSFLLKILRLPLSFFEQRGAGDLAPRTRLVEEIYTVLIKIITPAGMQMILSLAYGAILFTYNTTVAAVTLFGALLCLNAMYLIHRARVTNNLFFEKNWKENEALVLENFISLEPIKASGGESAFFDKWAGSYVRFLNTQQEFQYYETIISLLPYFIRFFCLSLLLITGYAHIIEGSDRIGMLIASILLLFLFLESWFRVIRLSETFVKIERSLSQMEDVDTAEEDLISRGSSNGSGEIELENVSFSYYPFSSPELIGISFNLTPGKRIGLTGPAGSGKSTLGKVAARLLHPTSGTVRGGGNLCWLGQEAYLFTGTLKENVTLWDPNISDGKVKEALELAGLGNWPLDFSVKENGQNLGRKERAQVEIARALVADFSYLIIDDALNPLSREEQQSALERLTRRKPATLLISHERELLSRCDEILLISEKTIQARGSDTELFEKNTLYRGLFE